uniref:Uncharacterized protein n=1 Tax=Ignisphaera aggregans TaxID=334771 RepID=A0A7C5YYD3_9CREN
MYIYVMLGLFKEDRFEYARALMNSKIDVSFISKTIAENLRCIEELEQYFDIYIPTIGIVKTNKICTVDKAILNYSLIELKTVFHVIEDYILRSIQCDAIIGKDTIFLVGYFN